jgi:hypothetical protein
MQRKPRQGALMGVGLAAVLTVGVGAWGWPARPRAETVGAYLAQQPTVDRDKLRVLSLGEAVPVAETTTGDGRVHNRRVEVRVYHLHWQ